jgi:hypothetical protein
MVGLGALWLPILVSAVVVFIASSLVWMVLPHHDSDWAGLPEETSILEAIRKAGVKTGQYRFPYAEGRKAMQSEEMKKRLAEGPAGFVVLWEKWDVSMGKMMGGWFLYLIGVSVFVAYLTGHVLAPGAPYLAVFRVAGTAAILAYAGALIPNSIWWGRSWSMTFKEVVDGVVYGLLTAGVFGWLWPR